MFNLNILFNLNTLVNLKPMFNLKKSVLVVCIFILSLSAQTVSADIDAYTFSSEEKRLAYQDLTKELRCPKCQNQDIKDSNAPIAQDMRREVRRLVEEGKSHKDVVDFMIERFGDFVTYKPKIVKETYLLWYGPIIFVALGLVFIFMIVKGRSKTANVQGSSSSSDSDSNSDSNSDNAISTDNESINNLLKKYDD